MNRAPILFRVDGTSRTGWEHLTRCLIFGAALQRRRRPTYFLSQLEPRSLGLNIKRAGNNWLEADGLAGTPDDLEETIQEIRRLQPAAVIVDAPETSEAYLKEIAATGVLVASIDSQAQVRFPSHMVINPLLAPRKESYEYQPGTQLLLGQRFTFIRPEVRRLRPVRAQEPPLPFRAMVALGEDDPHGLAAEYAKLLLNVPKVEKVDLVVRSWHPQLEELQQLVERCPDRLELAVEPNEVAARIPRCHFALTAGTGWSQELACVGLPQLMILQHEIYWPNAQRLEEEGAALCLGWHENVSAQTLRQAVVNLLSDPAERQAMSRCGRKLIDGRGPDRLVTALEIMLHPSRMLDMHEAA
ncbi:MAG: PseG/SpsG family protein [Gemmataceae bacterium]